jgi:DNA polymerase III subunit delta'
MSWNNIIGQNRVKSILKGIISNKRLPNAFLFFGNEGIGKDAVAIQIAKILNCSAVNITGDNKLIKDDIDSCDECENCLKFNKLRHPNLKMVFALPRGKNEKDHDDAPLDKLTGSEIEEIKDEIHKKSLNYYHRINVTGAREIRIISLREVKKLSSLSTTEGYYKVFLITNADELNTEAANSFLKLLEEPPEKTLFILTTSRKENILPTIVSRCQDLYFDDLSMEEIEHGLKTFFKFDEKKSRMLAQLSGGSFSRALKLTDDSFNEMRNNVVSFLRLILSNKFKEIYDEIDNILNEKDKIKTQIFLSMLLLWMRDLFLVREGLSEKIVNMDQKDSLESFNSRLPGADIFSSVDSIEEAIKLVERNVNLQIIFYSLIISLRKSILLKTN